MSQTGSSPVKTASSTSTSKLIKIGGVVPQLINAHHHHHQTTEQQQHIIDNLTFLSQPQNTQAQQLQPSNHNLIQQSSSCQSIQQQQHQINQSPQPQQQQQQQQVLNLVLVTDGINGGVSYLSLVPQN